MPQNIEHTSHKFWFPLAIALVMILGSLLGIKLQKEVPIVPTVAGETSVETKPGKIEELLRYIEARYVDDVDRDELVQKAINNLLKELTTLVTSTFDIFFVSLHTVLLNVFYIFLPNERLSKIVKWIFSDFKVKTT